MDKLCPYRSVSEDGRIICAKISQGDNEVSPNLCRDCPARAVACNNLRFSLQKSSPSPIIVRYAGGRTEVWDDDPPTISFLHAACTAKVAPISNPKQCVGCALRVAPLPQPKRQRGQTARQGAVVPFPRPAAQTG